LTGFVFLGAAIRAQTAISIPFLTQFTTPLSPEKGREKVFSPSQGEIKRESKNSHTSIEVLPARCGEIGRDCAGITLRVV